MAAEKEDKPGIIPLNDRQEKIELEVQYHTARVMLGKPFKVHKLYKHIELPDEKKIDPRELLTWKMEEIRRCKEGYDGLPAFYYYFFNHCKIKHKTRGTIRPDFRAWQLNFAKVKERVKLTKGLGLVSVKRRQVGASWDYAADNIYDCTFRRDFDIGMNSKSEADSRNLFLKHKFVHRNVSPFLRGKVHVDRRDAMVFSKWDKHTQKTEGTGCSIISVAPTPTGHAGNQYAKILIDEAGEIDCLMDLWANSEDCIAQDVERVGTPFIFGTMGETTRAGKGLMEFWLKHKLYNLEQFGIWGYNGLILDNFGNDMEEDAIRWILYEREKNKGKSAVVQNKFIQKYPLNEQDAFLSVTGSGVGSPMLLSKQYTKLVENPPHQEKGWMRPKPGGGVDFVPDELNGKIVVYERPMEIAHGYVAATDPAEDDEISKNRDTSNLSTAIVAKPFGLAEPRLAAEYTDRPAKLHDYYNQMALLLQWYNYTPSLIEMNKGGFRMKDWFELNYPKLLAWGPRGTQSVKQGYEMKIGIKKTSDREIQMLGLGDAYVENHSETIPSIRLIEEFKVYGAAHADDDLATAFLYCLVMLQSDRRAATGLQEEAAKNPRFKYMKVNGVLQLLPDGVTPTQRPQIRTTNPLFNKQYR